MPRFQLELHNGTSEGMVLEVGTTLGSGRFQYLDAFRYVLKDGDGKVADLTVPEPGSVFGNLPEPLAVPLSSGASLVLPIDFAKMRLERGDSADWRIHLAPGSYEFWVEYRHLMPATGVRGPGTLPSPSVPYWVGAIRTVPLRFEVKR